MLPWLMNTPTIVFALLLTWPFSAIGMLSISEFLAINASGEVDKDGDHSDWIEIHNSGESPADLTGYYLTDDSDNLTKWKIPKGKIPANGYTIIHASGKDFSSIFNTEVHANFSLSGDGEYLALVQPDGITKAHEFAPNYPDQQRNVSYGIANDREILGYFPNPSPGEANGAVSDGIVSSVTYSVKRGFFDKPISLQLTSDTPGAKILYTDNGKAPSLFTGKTYTEPISISATTTIRARAEKAGFILSKLKAHTYIFVDDVINQDTMSTKITKDPVYGPLMKDALLKHPAISLITEDTDISKNTEDSVSVEMIFPNGSDGFQIDAGVKRVGGHSLNAYPKNNMRLYFRSKYGAEKLRFPLYTDHPYSDIAADSFDQLNLRSGSHDSLFYLGASSPPQAPSNGQYLRNRWISDMQLLMGHESLRGRWVHVYINGNYWGHYQILERNTQDYFATYLGGQKSDYVAINKGQGIGSSDMSVWTAMRNARNEYDEFKRRVDVVNYVDYMLLNYYCGNNWDWNPEQNWAGGGPVEPDTGGMKFLAWDSDIIFRRLEDNNLAKGGPHNMFPKLLKNAEFATLVADRIQKHFYNDGLLTPENVAKYYNLRAEEIRLSIIAETARWQAGRWTRDNQWQAELNRLNDDFFPNRTEEILKQFRAKGWSGATEAPRINQFGGYVANGFKLQLSKGLFVNGTVVYTTDGSDPRLKGGELSLTASESPLTFTLTETTTVKARVKTSDGWSAMTEARFVVDQVPPSLDNLTISKIHYRPATANEAEVAAGYTSRKDFEFLELLNLTSDTIDLMELHFNKGINFAFIDATIASIGPGERIFLVRDVGAFTMRYGEGLTVAGTFSGSLSNDGEMLQLVNKADEVIQSLTYNNSGKWPTTADGNGSFLVLSELVKADPNNAEQWRASAVDQHPADNAPVSGLTYAAWSKNAFPEGVDSAPDADPDQDGFANVIEFVFESDPSAIQSSPKFAVTTTEAGNVRYTSYPRTNFSGIQLTVQGSNDLATWRDLKIELIETVADPNAGTVTYVLKHAGLGFFRLLAR